MLTNMAHVGRRADGWPYSAPTASSTRRAVHDRLVDHLPVQQHGSPAGGGVDDAFGPVDLVVRRAEGVPVVRRHPELRREVEGAQHQPGHPLDGGDGRRRQHARGRLDEGEQRAVRVQPGTQGHRRGGVLGLGPHDGDGQIRERGSVLRGHLATGVDPHGGGSPLRQPVHDVRAGLVLGLRHDRVLEVEDHEVGAGGHRLVESVRPDAASSWVTWMMPSRTTATASSGADVGEAVRMKAWRTVSGARRRAGIDEGSPTDTRPRTSRSSFAEARRWSNCRTRRCASLAKETPG